MKILFAYNMTQMEASRGRYTELFEKERRDSTFAYAYEVGQYIYAIRDHLGIVPLYYRCDKGNYRFSTNLTELVNSDSTLDEIGLRYYLKFKTSRIHPLFRDIKMVPPGSVVRIDKSNGGTVVLYQYRLKPECIPNRVDFTELVNRYDGLFRRAVERLVRHESVALYLSGGIDSAMIGIYLKKLGVRTHAYTSAFGNENDIEYAYSKQNAELINVDSHRIDLVRHRDYDHYLARVPYVYNVPHGAKTGISLTSMWENTRLEMENQIFLGQNSDTIACSMPEQSKVLRQNLFRIKRVCTRNVARQFVAMLPDLREETFDCPLIAGQAPDEPSVADLLVLLGILYGYTPCDSETFSQPAIENGNLIADPYYDMDLVEFQMGIPFRHRLELSMPRVSSRGPAAAKPSRDVGREFGGSGKGRQTKRLLKAANVLLVEKRLPRRFQRVPLDLKVQKKVSRGLALRYLPKDVVFRKAGFGMPYDESRLSVKLPHTVSGVELGNPSLRLAAFNLQTWLESTL